MEQVITDVYNKCKAQLLCPKERFVNYVKEIYAPFSDEEIAAKMVEILKSDNVNAKVQIVYQTLEGHKSCALHLL